MEAKTQKEVFTVTDKDGHSYWRKLGVGYINKDGSMNLYLDALPINGRLQVRDPKPREDFAPRGPQPPFEPAGIQ